MNIEFKNLKPFVPLGICLFSLVSCGQDEIELKVGPKMSGIIKAADEKQKAELEALTFRQELQKCGSDTPLSDEDLRKPGLLRSIGLEEIHPTNLTAPQKSSAEQSSGRLAITLEGNIFNYKSFESEMTTSVSLKNSLVKDKKITFSDPTAIAFLKKLTPPIPPSGSRNSTPASIPSNIPPRAPILIRTQCFYLGENETIETDGRDIYIVSGLVKIRGTIRTTPSVIEDYPGRPGGSIYLVAVETDLKDAFFDVSGGDAGAITSKIALPEDERAALERQIRLEFIDEMREMPEEFRKPRWPELNNPINKNDIDNIIQAWEERRETMMHANPTGAEKEMLESSVVTKALKGRADDLAKLLAHPGITKAQRAAVFANRDNLKNWRRAWELSLKEAIEKFDDANRAPSLGSTLDFWIIQNRFSAQISSVIYRDALKGRDSKIPNFKSVPKNKFDNLPGGRPGSIFIHSINSIKPKALKNDGRPTVHSDQGAWPFSHEEKIKTVLRVQRRDIVSIVLRKMKDDKDSINAVWYAPIQNESSVEVAIPIIASTAAPTLRSHPHSSDRFEPTGSTGDYPDPTKDITGKLEDWGVQSKGYEELFRTADEKLNDRKATQ